MMAAGVGLVAAFKDQGICRWNMHTMRSLHRHVKSGLGSVAEARIVPAAASRRGKMDEPATEESLRRVMYLSCWGPN